jgi:hypothetical protein
VLSAATLGVPLLVGIWLPDVFSNQQHTVAFQRLSSGHSFRVIQYWNHGDFYNTELIHTFPDGQVISKMLAPDDNKSWRVPLWVDEGARHVGVVLSDRRTLTLDW